MADKDGDILECGLCGWRTTRLESELRKFRPGYCAKCSWIEPLKLVQKETFEKTQMVVIIEVIEDLLSEVEELAGSSRVEAEARILLSKLKADD